MTDRPQGVVRPGRRIELSGPASPVRVVTVTIVSIALAEITAMAVVHVLQPPPFWPATLLDVAVMVALILPALHLLVFRPLTRLVEERRSAEEALSERTRRLEVLAAENAELYYAEQRARTTADTLGSAGLAITRSLDLESVFAALLDHLGRLVPYDRAKVMLLEGESRLKVRALSSPSKTFDFIDKPFDSFDVSTNAAVRDVVTSGRALSIPDTHAAWGARLGEDIERSWLGVPLLAGGKPIGLYTLVKADAGFFTPEHIHLAEALSAPASVAIANARLFEQLRANRHRLRILARNYVSAHETERRRIARELHDEAGQLLSSMTLGLGLLEREGASDVVRARTRELRQVADSVQEGLHRLAADLRPAALDHAGLVPALQQLAVGVSLDGGPTIHVETLGLEGVRPSPDVETALYRIAQEALRNAVRHSGARQISVVVERRDDHILMVVEDDGRGFDSDSSNGSARLGLLGIRERAEMLGGNLLIESNAGSGSTLVVEVPYAV
jgi:signal transduction histidine kinase